MITSKHIDLLNYQFSKIDSIPCNNERLSASYKKAKKELKLYFEELKNNKVSVGNSKISQLLKIVTYFNNTAEACDKYFEAQCSPRPQINDLQMHKQAVLKNLEQLDRSLLTWPQKAVAGFVALFAGLFFELSNAYDFMKYRFFAGKEQSGFLKKHLVNENPLTPSLKKFKESAEAYVSTTKGEESNHFFKTKENLKDRAAIHTTGEVPINRKNRADEAPTIYETLAKINNIADHLQGISVRKNATADLEPRNRPI